MAVLNNPIFPITNNTFVGTATDEQVQNYGAVHCVDAGILTVTTGNGSNKVLNCGEGQDVNVAGCKSVTSDMEVWIS